MLMEGLCCNWLAANTMAARRMSALFMTERSGRYTSSTTDHVHITKIHLIHIIGLPHIGANPPEF